MNKEEKIEYLKEFFSPYTNRVYFVGGYVRDIILGIDCDDIDIEVFGIDIELFEILMDKLCAKGVGKSFFVYKWHGIDISLPRTEKKVSHGHRGFDVSLAYDEKIASLRRDFTMNALMKNIYTGKILDFWNGINDIKNKKIKVVDARSFIEDSLRVLRAVRFSAKYGFKICESSLNLMQNMDLSDLSKQRLQNELLKIFSTDHLEYGLYYFFKLKPVKTIFDLDISRRDFFVVTKVLIKSKRYFNKEIYKYYLLYIISSFIKINFSKLPLPKIYEKTICSQPKLNFNVTNKELAAIAIDIPIKNWLGAINEDIINRAKQLNIFENTIETHVTSKEVMDEGFKKDEIKKEIYRRKLKYINDRID